MVKRKQRETDRHRHRERKYPGEDTSLKDIPPPNYLLSPGSPYLLKFPEPLKIVPPARDQPFNI
jgi:hypothetical protein